MKRSVTSLLLLACFLMASACSQSPQRLLDAANRYHDKKKYPEASILYRKAIAKDKTFAEAYYREGLNLLDQNNPVEASKFLRRAVDLNPNNADAEIKLAEIYLTAYALDPQKFKNLLPEIKDLTGKILKRDPHDFHGIRLQAFIYLADKNMPKAIETFQVANQLRPHSRELVGWLAQTLVADQQFGEAEKLMRDMIAHDKTWGPAYDFLFVQYSKQNKTPEAEQILKDRITNDPQNSLSYINYSNFLLAHQRYPEAEQTMKKLLDDPKAFPNRHQLLGDFYARSAEDMRLTEADRGQRRELALAEYREGSKENPKENLVYQQRIIATLSRLGTTDPAKQVEAIKLAKQLSDDNPKDLLSNQIYASLLLDTGLKQDVNKSLTELKALVKNHNTDPILHLDLARAYFFLNQQDEALAEALEAVRLKPNLGPARSIAARIYEDRGQHGKALEQTEIVLAGDKNNAEARLTKDRALAGLKEFDKALPDLELLQQQFPTYNDALYELGNVYVELHNPQKAQAVYQKLWEGTGPNVKPDIRGFLGLQTLKMQEGKWQDAVAALRDLVQKNPKTLTFRYTLANFQARAAAGMPGSDPQRKTLLQDAANNYQEILKTTANSSDVWLRLGSTQQLLGQNDAALASYEQASQANPSSAPAFLNRAMLLELMGQKDKARDAYNRVLGVDSNNMVALNNLSFLYADSGQNIDQAVTLAERAKKNNPNNPNISDTLGYVYLKKGLIDDAYREFQFAVNAQPKNAIYRLHLAMSLLKRGDKSGAKREAESALANANHDEQGQIQTFMSQIG